MSSFPSLGLGLGRFARRNLRAAVDRSVRWGVPTDVPRIVRTLPHDPQAYTQGLLYREGQLYESTGGHHASSLRTIDPANGAVQRIVNVKGDFAEGIAALGERLYQVAWKSGTARVYRLPDLALIDQLPYHGEGWGLAASDGQLIMSNGTSVVSLRDASFNVVRTLRTKSHGIPVRRLNDLECVAGSIYANVWPTTDILEFSAHSGRLQRVVDCSALASAVRPRDDNCVLNGIAYNQDRDTFFVTGKNWKLLFEVEIPPATAGPPPTNDARADGSSDVADPALASAAPADANGCPRIVVQPIVSPH